MKSFFFLGGGSIYRSHNIFNPLLLTMETNKSMSHNHSILNPHPENVFWAGSIYRSHNSLNPLHQTMETMKSMSHNHVIPNPHPKEFFWGGQYIAAIIFWTPSSKPWKPKSQCLTTIVFWIPTLKMFLRGSIYGSHNILNPGSLYYSHNIMNPDSISYKGVQNIAAIFWTWVQNIMRYFEPRFNNFEVSKYYTTPVPPV
jgi:hypothetical protein